MYASHPVVYSHLRLRTCSRRAWGGVQGWILEMRGPPRRLCAHMKVKGPDHHAASLCPVGDSLCAMSRWCGWWQQGRQGRGGALKGHSRQQRLLQGNSQGKAERALQVD